MVHEFPDLIDSTLLSRAEALSTAQLCDGMKELGIPGCGCISHHINAVDPAMRVTGTAMTVETDDGDNFPIHVATYAIPRDGYVMVIDGKGCFERSYLGDLIMSAAKAAGYLGIVIDGLTRDRADNIQLNFPVFSRGFMPAGPVKKNPGSINTPILCGGIQVCPGDLIVGDYDGVCVVPRAQIGAILEKAEAKKAYESKREAAIHRYAEAKRLGQALPQLAPQWVLDLLKES